MIERLSKSQGAVVATLTDQQDLRSSRTCQVVSNEKQKALWELIQKRTPELTEEQKLILHQLFVKVADVFPDKKGEIGKTTILQHKIYTREAAPNQQSSRRIPVTQREEMQEDSR